MNGTLNQFALDDARVPPRLPSAKRRPFTWCALTVLAGFAAGAAVFWFDPAQSRFYPFCYFHELTGLHCPGCGGTRALHQLLHGNVRAALQLNALLVVSLPLFAGLGVWFAVKGFRRQAAGWRVSPTWFWMFLALAAVFGVLRNLSPFAWLSP